MHQVVTAQLAAARRAPRARRPGPRSPAAAPSPSARRAPAGPARARPGRPTGPAVAIALGPKPRSYRQRTPKKMIRLALASALSDRAAEGKVVVVDSWGFESAADQGRRRRAGRPRRSTGKVLVVVVHRDDELAIKSFRNLARPAARQPSSTPTTCCATTGRSPPTSCRCSDYGRAAPAGRRPLRAQTATSETRLSGRRHERSRDDPAAGRVGEVLRPARRGRLHVRRPPGRQQDRDPPGGRGDLQRPCLKVNTLNRKGKRKRNRRSFTFGKRPDTKRAIVTLAG